MDLLNLKPEVFGLDISDLSLKIIKLKKRAGFFRLASIGEKNIPPGVIKEGEIKDQKLLSEIIKQAAAEVKGEKLKTRYVVASLPEEKAFLQIIQLPKMSEDDLKSAIVFEAENYIPLPLEEVYLDYQVVKPVKNHLDHFDILLAGLPKKTVDPYVSSLKSAGLELLALEIESLAIARALIKQEISPSPVLLIDFGATRTGFVVFSGRSIQFTSSIAVSSRHFSQIIAKSLGVSEEEAEKLKTKYGLAETKKGKKQIFEALIPALVDLIQQIKKHLDFYQTHAFHEHLLPDQKGVAEILICGGGANLKGLTGLLSLKLGLPVKVASPWINILPEEKKETVKLSLENSLRYVTALGLALRAIKREA